MINFKNIYKNEDFFQIIGYISIAFASLDFRVMILLYRLMDGKGIEKLKINDNTTLGQKLNLLNALEKEDVGFPLVLAEFKKILPQVIEITKERNRYMHDQWVFNQSKIINGEIDRLRIERRNKLNVNVIKMKTKTFSINSLNEFLNTIILMQNKIDKITKKVPLINKSKIDLS